MSDSETKLADQRGKFTQVVKDGHTVPEIEWIAGRILLSNKRVVLVGKQGKRTIPLSKIRSVKSRKDAPNPLAQVSSYVSLQVGQDVTLVSPQHHAEFEQALYSAVLDQEVVAVKHPAVEGGVVQSTPWAKGRVTLEFENVEQTEHGTVALATADGQFVEVEIHDVATIVEKEGEVLDEKRFIIEVEHTVAATAVETHISGTKSTVAILASLLRRGEQQNTVDVDLSEAETEVLMALYSGVSPFQIPEFIGMDIERVEDIYDQLIEEGILKERHVRREVTLKARGRHVASEAMGRE